MDNLHPDSRAVHPPVVDVPATSRPVGTPIYQTHIFTFDDSDDLANTFHGPPEGRGYVYSRYGNPTVQAFGQAVAEMEGGVAALTAGSGMGAVSGVLLALLQSGDHVVAQRCLYGGTMSLLGDLTERWGVTVDHVSGNDPEEVRAALRPETRLLILETIANPTTQVADLPALAAVAREAGVTVLVDNTFATPLLCRPLEHGVDIVLHSATKYLGGHADVIAGVAVFADTELHERVWKRMIDLGSVLDPHSAHLLLRGLATLPLRMRRQGDNAQALAERLARHPAVTHVAYPGLPDHPQHELAGRLLDGGYGGVLSFELAGGREAGRVLVEALRLVSLAPSLGDVRTLAMHPASTSHNMLDAAALAAAGISESTVRLSVGIEHPDDLWADLEQALTKVS
ncbi:trans-sulfuration enzyme family protein [Actinomadura hibisca]|uniref:trans-sulfuration enzyme family protein n=1 Tax=Actinomadura hibisca TaxID=68565 RepID=UPI00082D0978|nr:aminotransferase class I/II-fold pyridoxal phosphate-dependent enzyme [Actinomadura hibisca]